MTTIPTPYNVEIANTRGEYTRDLLMAKAEGYRARQTEEDARLQALLEAAKEILPCLKRIEDDHPQLMPRGMATFNRFRAAIATYEEKP